MPIVGLDLRDERGGLRDLLARSLQVRVEDTPVHAPLSLLIQGEQEPPRLGWGNATSRSPPMHREPHFSSLSTSLKVSQKVSTVCHALLISVVEVARRQMSSTRRTMET